MLPLIIVSREEDTLERYLKNYISKRGFSPSLIFKIRPLANQISINQIRELRRDLIIGTSNIRLVVFYDFDKSSLEAQNSLLKILEDQTDTNQFILICNNAEKILATIRSRSKVILLDQTTKKLKLEKDYKDFLDKIRVTPNLGFLNDGKVASVNKEDCLFFLNQIISYFQDQIRNRPDQSKIEIRILNKVLSQIQLVENNNLNPQLCLDNLLIFIWKSYSMKLYRNAMKLPTV